MHLNCYAGGVSQNSFQLAKAEESMPKLLLAIVTGAAVGASISGCATSADEERRAARHEYFAERAAGRGDYERATEEQLKANDARRRAAQKAAQEAAEPPPSIVPPQLPPVP